MIGQVPFGYFVGVRHHHGMFDNGFQSSRTLPGIRNSRGSTSAAGEILLICFSSSSLFYGQKA